jgi:hypothetical protein
MPIECLVVWVIALHNDREETILNEELIQEEKMEEMEERAEKKGRECGNTPTQ